MRQAVNYAVDPAALERIYAGQLAATQQILPPGMPGYKKFEPLPARPGQGEGTDRRSRPQRPRDHGLDRQRTAPTTKRANYYEACSSELGFDTTLKVVSADNYFTVIGNGSTPDLDTGWANWFEDYPHPNDFFQPLLAGESIEPTNNTNWSQFDDPALNAKIDQLGAEQLGPDRKPNTPRSTAPTWNRRPWAPFGTLTALHLRLQRDRPRQGHLQPDLRPGPDQLRVQVVAV